MQIHSRFQGQCQVRIHIQQDTALEVSSGVPSVELFGHPGKAFDLTRNVLIGKGIEYDLGPIPDSDPAQVYFRDRDDRSPSQRERVPKK